VFFLRSRTLLRLVSLTSAPPRRPAFVALVSAFAPTPPTRALSSLPALALRPATSHAARGLTTLSMAESKKAKVGAACVRADSHDLCKSVGRLA
jgi:hypothetical protein